MSKLISTNHPKSSYIGQYSYTEQEQQSDITYISLINIKYVIQRKYNSEITVVIAVRIHLFPFRTEKLSSLAPMVLLHQVGE